MDVVGIILFLLIGAVAGFVQNIIMIYVTQGTMRNMRNELFEKMEKLYFPNRIKND